MEYNETKYEKCKGCSTEVLYTMFIKCMDCPTELCFMCIENETCPDCTLKFKKSLDQEKEPNEEKDQEKEPNEEKDQEKELKDGTKFRCEKCLQYFDIKKNIQSGNTKSYFDYVKNIQLGEKYYSNKCRIQGCNKSICGLCCRKKTYICMDHICRGCNGGKTIEEWGNCSICNRRIHFKCHNKFIKNNIYLKDICEKHILICWCLEHYGEIEENLCSESINIGIDHYCCPRCSFKTGIKRYCSSHRSTCKLCFQYYPSTQKYSFNCKQDIEMCEECHNKICSTFFTMLLCNKKLGINIYKDLKVCLFNSLMEKVVLY